MNHILLLYFAMYLTISILFTRKHPFSSKNYVDDTLVFGLSLAEFPQLYLYLLPKIKVPQRVDSFKRVLLVVLLPGFL